MSIKNALAELVKPEPIRIDWKDLTSLLALAGAILLTAAIEGGTIL